MRAAEQICIIGTPLGGAQALAPNLVAFSENFFSDWTIITGGTAATGSTPTPSSTLTLGSQQQLPDATGGTTGHSFTNTGLTKDTVNNSFWVGNFQRPGLVQVSLDGTTLISQFGVSPITGVQGVAYDSINDNLWWTGAGDGLIYNVSKTGTALGSIAGPSNTLNGLAYDSLRDQFWVSDSPNLYRINRAGVVQWTFNGTGQGGPYDQICYDAGRDCLWLATGPDGSPGQLWQYDITNDRIACELLLGDCLAIEGLFVSGTSISVCNDGFFHSVPSPDNINSLQFYTLPGTLPTQVYNRVFSQYAPGPSVVNGRLADRLILNKGTGTTSSDFVGIFRTSQTLAGTNTWSVYMRSRDGVSSYNVGLRLTSAVQQNKVVTGTWTRFTFTGTAIAAAQAQIILRGTFGSDNFVDILATAAMVQAGSFATAYNARLGA